MEIEWSKQDYLYYITKTTNKHNLDNISRTKAYQHFYFQFTEIKWALVASVVSRNAGYNMTDLHLPLYREILSHTERQRLFMTYERANWLIFSDAYPQLLVYKLSLKANRPLFTLLEEFDVSSYMIKEWNSFWKTKDKDRLMIALIINEQNVIHTPVIKQHYFKYNVFLRLPYLMQDLFMMSAVLIPTPSKKIYGQFVHDFTKLTNRISLGKKIASIIFSKEVYPNLSQFIISVDHTGSRKDYEQFLEDAEDNSPYLRTIYPIITHQDKIRNDWYNLGGLKKDWIQPLSCRVNPKVGQTFYKKRNLLYAYYHIKKVFK